LTAGRDCGEPPEGDPPPPKQRELPAGGMGRREIHDRISRLPRLVVRRTADRGPYIGFGSVETRPPAPCPRAAPRTTSEVRPADPGILTERGESPPADRCLNGLPRGLVAGGGAREARDPVVFGGSPASLSSRQGALHASGRSSLGGYPQCPTVVKRTRHEVREFSKLATLSLSPARARDTKSTDSSVRRAIVSGVSVTPTRRS
jgi:hypothetical protein